VEMLIASPFLGDHLIVRQGSTKGMRISPRRFNELLARHGTGDLTPSWLKEAAYSYLGRGH
jgi:hypothetical protein